MTTIDKYQKLSSLTFELIKLLEKERHCYSFGGQLPKQDKDRKRVLEGQIKPLLLNLETVKQLEIV